MARRRARFLSPPFKPKAASEPGNDSPSSTFLSSYRCVTSIPSQEHP